MVWLIIVIISCILMTWMFDPQVILWGESRGIIFNLDTFFFFFQRRLAKCVLQNSSECLVLDWPYCVSFIR